MAMHGVYFSNTVGVQPAIANTKIANKFCHLWSLVGNTPMLKLHYLYKGKIRSIYVKCEQYNLTGSIKDRMALYILQKAYEQGYIKRVDTIVEASNGNTGISFSAIGKALGHTVKIIAPDWMGKGQIDIMKSLGAEIILVSKEKGGLLGSIAISEEWPREMRMYFFPDSLKMNTM